MSHFQSADHAAFTDAQAWTEDGTQQSLDSLLSASHYLDANNPLGRTLAIKHRANVISTGAMPVFDKALFGEHYQQLMQDWRSWTKYCHFDGFNNFASALALASITAFLSGSAFVLRRTDKTKPLPLTLQVVSARMLATELHKDGKRRYVKGGILYNQGGQPLKYAFYRLSPNHPSHDPDRITWIDANDVAHIRDQRHSGQGLAEPGLTSGFLMVNQWQDSQTIETKARLGKIATSVHYRTDPKPSHHRQDTPNTPAPKIKVRSGGFAEVEADEVVFAPNRELAGNYQEHNLQTLRQSAQVADVTYEQASGDYSKTSFSSARMARADQQTVLNQKRVIMFEHALNKIVGWFLDVWQFSRDIRLADFSRNPYGYFPDWLWPPPEDIDPLKAAKANEVKLKTGEISARELAIHNGKNPDVHLATVADERQRQSLLNT